MVSMWWPDGLPNLLVLFPSPQFQYRGVPLLAMLALRTSVLAGGLSLAAAYFFVRPSLL